jgi:redox-sensitive bicupin YhaK (pirin superfamily)
MTSDARWTLPAAEPGLSRTLYFYKGSSIKMSGHDIPLNSAVQLRSDVGVDLQNGPAEANLLLLQGKPIGEPVVQYGPFVMTSREEIQQTFADYQRTGFGGWPWPTDDPVLPRSEGRHARHADGRVEHVA